MDEITHNTQVVGSAHWVQDAGSIKINIARGRKGVTPRRS